MIISGFYRLTLAVVLSSDFVFSAQVVHTYGNFEAVTFERKAYPPMADKQSFLVQKTTEDKNFRYDPKYDMFVSKKDSASTRRKSTRLSKKDKGEEAQVSAKNPPPTPVDHKDFSDLPFDGSGRLHAENDVFIGVGSATLFDHDLIITAGHNFVRTINGEKYYFSKCFYQHKSKHKEDCRFVPLENITVHPKWESDEDSDYDVAVAFLPEKLPLRKRLSLLKGVPIAGTGILVTGYPDRTEDMHQSTGKVVQKKKKEELKVYHDANTRVGNSGGSIVLDDTKAGTSTRGRDIVVGVHTGVEDLETNRGVRLRKDILDFVATAIENRESDIIKKN